MTKYLFILFVLNIIYLPVSSQMNYCSDNSEINKQVDCENCREQLRTTHKVKSIKKYNLYYTNNGDSMLLLRNESFYNKKGETLYYKAYRNSAKAGGSKLFYKIKYTYNKKGQMVDEYETHYDNRKHPEHSCLHHKPIRFKYTYQNDKVLTFRSFFYTGKACEEKRYQYLDSNRIVKTYNYENGKFKLTDIKKYNNFQQLVSHYDNSYGDEKNVLYTYDSLRNLTAKIHIFSSGDTSIQRIDYKYNSNNEIVSKIKFNIYKRPKLDCDYTRTDSTIRMICYSYNTNGDFLGENNEAVYNLNGNIIYSDKANEIREYEYNSNNMIYKSTIKYLYNSKDEILIYKYEYY